MKGIYKFTNRINNKVYIGQSINLVARYNSHKRNYINSNLNSYNSLFYRALRKYGFDNFDYEILIASEKLTMDELNSLEQAYIKQYDAYLNGYNMNPGGNNTGSNYFISLDIILQIKNDLLNSPNLTLEEITKKYKISSTSIISSINSGKSYSFVGEFNYPIRSKEIIKKEYQGENNGRAIFSNDQVIYLREQYQYYILEELYKAYKNDISYSAFRKIIYGTSYPHLPIYKKHKNKWYLDGTCIDYPREVEQKDQ